MDAESEMKVWDYLRHVKKRLVEEAERCDIVIGSQVKGGVLRIVEESLVGAHTGLLLERGMKTATRVWSVVKN